MSEETTATGTLYRAVIEYDGSDLLGFQIQANGPTVQGELERILHLVTQQSVRVVGSGRTDAGVHALGQVVAFRAQWRHSPSDLHRALNALSPAWLSIHQLDIAPDGFHPRFSAIERWYRYQVGQWSGHAPLRARYAWQLGPALDVGAMNQAAAHLPGAHDFASFGQPPQGENTVRTVTAARWHPDPPYLYFDIRANAFLRQMVRSIVGTLISVGRGQRSPDEFADILTSRQRALAAPPAPPQGLILMAVTYPTDSDITRQFRLRCPPETAEQGDLASVTNL